MSTLAAFEAIEDYIRAECAVRLAGVTVVFENETYQPADVPEPFIFVEVYSFSRAMVSIGSGDVTDNRWREDGAILLHVMTPSGTGTRLARNYATILSDMFRINNLGPIDFNRSNDGASIGATERSETDGNYFRLTVRVDFQRDG